MTTVDRWQLPDGIDELLPPSAQALEELRRQLLDLYRSWGYELVIPPLVEFTESLLTGLGADLDLLTFRLTDQQSGRLMGLRADITPQVARIDAHSLPRDGISRLCYAGSTLHTRPKTMGASRSPIQAGVELYGEAGIAADLEVIELMLETLACVGIAATTLDLGHTGIYEAVLRNANLPTGRDAVVFDALQRKSRPDLTDALADCPAANREALLLLLSLHGDLSVLEHARTGLAAVPDALRALDTLDEIASQVRVSHPDVSLYFDLAELRGYHYHTGMVFAAYVPGRGQALANGGRYDAVGESFGRSRPATGFNTDLRALLGYNPGAPQSGAISLPVANDPALRSAAAELRSAGETVVAALDGVADPRCDRELVKTGGHWVVRPL